MKKSAIVVAGGLGSRMNAGTPKQFLVLAGKPLLMHSIERFSHACPGIFLVVALPADQFTTWQELCREYSFDIPHQTVSGGETRFHSVQHAMAVIPGEGLVAIHDGARPLVTETLILTAFKTAEQLGNCIPVLPLHESLRMVSGDASHPVDRNDYRLVQTPQVFHSATIKKAYQQDYRERFTDDAAVAESMGETIHLTGGDPVNIKITRPGDLAVAELLLATQSLRA